MTAEDLEWDNFKTYLEEYILEKNATESGGTNQKHLLKNEAKVKYSITDDQKFLKTLTNLINSIDNEDSEDYHSLPELLVEKASFGGEEKEFSQSWSELFPNREKVFFGAVNEQEIIDVNSFNALEKIYTDFIRPGKLEEIVNDEELVKIMMTSAINLTYETIKHKGIDKIFEQWLADYEKLTGREKNKLSERKNMVSQLLNLFKEEEQRRQEQNNGNWFTNLPWENIVWYGGGGLLIILVLGYWWKKVKK